jgi:hypothetical protein
MMSDQNVSVGGVLVFIFALLAIGTIVIPIFCSMGQWVMALGCVGGIIGSVVVVALVLHYAEG